jgi:hypothetical protein
MRFELLIAIVGCSSSSDRPFCAGQPFPAIPLGAVVCDSSTPATQCCYACQEPGPLQQGRWLAYNCGPHCPAFPDAGLPNCNDVTCDSAQVMSHTECLACQDAEWKHAYCCQEPSFPVGICIGDPPDGGDWPDAGD